MKSMHPNFQDALISLDSAFDTIKIDLVFDVKNVAFKLTLIFQRYKSSL